MNLAKLTYLKDRFALLKEVFNSVKIEHKNKDPFYINLASSHLYQKIMESILLNPFDLPKDLCLCIAKFISNPPDLLIWIILTCLERDKETNKMILSSQLKKILEEKKKESEYVRRSKQKKYFSIYSISVQSADAHKGSYRMYESMKKSINYTSPNYPIYLKELPEPFNPLRCFDLGWLEFVEDGNGKLNDRFEYVSEDGYTIYGCFKNSKMVGNTILKTYNNHDLYILPIGDPILERLFGTNLINKLERFELTPENKEEYELISQSTDKFY